MTTLWITKLPSSELLALKAIREAQRFFDAESSMTTAQEGLDVFGHDGFLFVGEIDSTHGDPLRALRASLRNQGCETRLDLNPDDYARQVRARRLTEAGATPEQVFAAEAPGHSTELAQEAQEAGVYSTAAYETALVLMAQASGNPLKAAAVASMLARTTEDDSLYFEVIAALCGPFPWLHPALVDQGILANGR